MATTPSAPSVPAMTPAEAADHPRALGLTRVDEVEVGDVVYFVRQQVHAHVHPAGEHLTTLPERGAARRPDRVDLLWLDGYQPCGRYRGLRLADLDALAAAGHVRLVEAGVTDPYDRWALAPTGDNTEYDPVTPAPRLPTSQLTFDRCRSRTRTNGFLEHPVVNHKRGGVRFGRARFVARRPDDRLAAVAVLDRPSAGALCDGTTIELARYASHPEGHGVGPNPNNTASWMLSRACRWAALEGFDRVVTYSGVAANDGGIYKAANFERAYPTDSDGDGWTNRDGRSAWTNASERVCWQRHLHAGEPTPGVARRADARVGTDASGRPTLSSFATQQPAGRTTDAMALTREELTDDHEGTPAAGRRLAERARALFDAEGPAAGAAVLTADRAERARGRPPAVFGADVDGELVAALAVGGDALESPATATVVGYAARETAFPQQTATWLLARAREWAALDGYAHLHVPEETFAAAAPSTASVATCVACEPVRADGDTAAGGFRADLTRE